MQDVQGKPKAAKSSINFILRHSGEIREGGYPVFTQKLSALGQRSVALIQKLYKVLLALIASPVVFVIRALRPLILIRFGRLRSSRIGHFAANTEKYLSHKDIHRGDKPSFDIFYHTLPISNYQMKKMWERIMRVWRGVRWIDEANRILPGGGKHIILSIENDRDKDGLFAQTNPHVFFTQEEEQFGQEEIGRIGIPDETSFICFFARDDAYLKNANKAFSKGNWSYHDYRDSSIHDYISAVTELVDGGYYAVRMGAIVKEGLNTSNPGIIDYAKKYRTDFLDIYLSAKCRFFICDTAGIFAIPNLFRVPIVIVNHVPLERAHTWSKDHLFIPKKIWLKNEKRFLTFSEILSSEIGRFDMTSQYESMGIEAVENTPEEIKAVVLEMEKRLKGEWSITDEDEELQRCFWKNFRKNDLNNVILARVGADFLRQNRGLLK